MAISKLINPTLVHDQENASQEMVIEEMLIAISFIEKAMVSKKFKLKTSIKHFKSGKQGVEKMAMRKQIVQCTTFSLYNSTKAIAQSHPPDSLVTERLLIGAFGAGAYNLQLISAL